MHINFEFRWACQNGDLDKVKYLLTSTDINVHADIHAQDDYGFRLACANGHLEVVKYLLTSPELKEYADIHKGFRCACINGGFKILNFFVYDMNLQLSLDVRRKINSLNNKEEILNLFDKRDFEGKLQNNLKVKVQDEKPVKQTKI